MLSTPAVLPNENSVNIQSRLVEVSETIWNQLGWEELRKDSTQELQGLLDGPQTAQLLKSLEETKGVDLLTAPRITTANGREAQIVIGSGNDDDDKLRIGVIPTQTPGWALVRSFAQFARPAFSRRCTAPPRKPA